MRETIPDVVEMQGVPTSRKGLFADRASGAFHLRDEPQPDYALAISDYRSGKLAVRRAWATIDFGRDASAHHRDIREGIIRDSPIRFSQQIPQDAIALSPVARLFVKVAERWSISTDEAVILLGFRDVPATGLAILEGKAPLIGQDCIDRVAYITGISAGLRMLLGGSVPAERQWLRAPRSRFNKPALAHLLEGHFVQVLAVWSLVNELRGT